MRVCVSVATCTNTNQKGVEEMGMDFGYPARESTAKENSSFVPVGTQTTTSKKNPQKQQHRKLDWWAVTLS